MSRATQRRAEALARTCEQQGFRVKRTRHGYVAYSKDRNGGSVGWHTTPSDSRAVKNLIADLRRIGVEV